MFNRDENDFMANYFASLCGDVCHSKKIWYSASTLLCTFVLVFSTKLFSCALRKQNLGFQQYLNFFHAPRVRLISKRPSERSSPLSTLFCYAPLPGLDSNKLKSNPRSAAQHDTLIANPIAFPIHNLIILY